MGYLMKEVETLGVTDVTPLLQKVLLRLASALEDVEAAVTLIPEERVEPK